MRYRIIDEPEIPASPPWDPRVIFWSALLSGLLCPVAWMGGMVGFAINWARLQQPHARNLAWSLLIIGVFIEAHLFIYGFVVGGRRTLTQDLLRQVLSLLPMVLLLLQLLSQQAAFAAYLRRGATSARAAPIVLGFAALAIGSLWLFSRLLG